MKDERPALKDRLLEELEAYFGPDAKRIRHAKEVLKYAEEILKHESADPEIVIAASILHDVGIKAAEEKYGSSAGHYQEMEGPAIAKRILVREGVGEKSVEEICLIIGHHHSPGVVNTGNFKVLYDADWLVNLRDEVGPVSSDKLRDIIARVFLTGTGRTIAEKVYISEMGTG